MGGSARMSGKGTGCISSPFVSCSCYVSHDNLLAKSFPTVAQALNPDPGVRDKPSSFPENALKFLKIEARSRARGGPREWPPPRSSGSRRISRMCSRKPSQSKGDWGDS
jgi:hypothetical protein